jgi:hypothetical protein
LEAAYGFSIRFKDLKQAMYSVLPQNQFRLFGERSKLYVSIALHSFFQATQQQIQDGPVQLTYVGAVKHHARAINAHLPLQIAKEQRG